MTVQQGITDKLSRALPADPRFTRFEPETDEALIQDLLGVLTSTETDMTVFFRKLPEIGVDALSVGAGSDVTLIEPLMSAHYAPDCVQTTHRMPSAKRA
jgi:uncharacterized protein YdiU (UPF0061 family)